MAHPLNTIEQLISWAKAQLQTSESPVLDARLLLCYCIDRNQTYLMTWPDKPVDAQSLEQFKELVALRAQGHPVAHLLGYRDFWTLRLKVNPTTLIPRPETELLVEKALSFDLPDNAKVLDLGTGTGAIALALASERPDWEITGVDFRNEAVELARANANENALQRVNFVKSDWFSELAGQSFDLIVSNPPYVEAQSEYLLQGDVRFEPQSALTAGPDGLDDIRFISSQVNGYLNKSGWLVFEHGHFQGPDVQQILIQSGLDRVNTEQDLNQQPRITFARKSH